MKFTHYACVTTSLDESLTLAKALQRKDRKYWKETVDAEYNFLLQNELWELVKFLGGRKAMDYKWVFLK